MEPNDVADKYLKQASRLSDFIELIKNGSFTNEQYKSMLIMICEKYFELLMNLATFTPLLTTYKVKFYPLKSLNGKDLSVPPFDEDYFNNHEI